jgi:cation:H+ antiporter
MSWLTIAQLAGGSVLLILGAEWLIRGGSRLALAFGISPLVIGLTVVAFGTSAPEFAVTARAAYQGAAAVALGNVVGSNIFNILFILGLSAVVAPLIVSVQLVRIDVPIMIGASLLMAGLGVDGSIGRLDGALLFAGILGYTFFLIRQSRRETLAAQAEYEGAYGTDEARKSRVLINLLLVAAGMAALGLGGDWLVIGATETARALGVSELVIGLTIVAVGTSLPEVATSVLASFRGERDIAVGNLVGSNLFNLLAVLGLGGLIAPDGIPVPQGALTFDIPVMIGAAIAALPIFFTGYTIARWEGALLTGFYVAYAAVILMEAAEHPALSEFGMAMKFFVIPLTAFTLIVRAFRARHQPRPGA